MNLAKPPEKYPLLIVLSYWEGDRELAKKAAWLMADLQPHHVGNVAEIMIACRQDSLIDQAMVEKLSTRFNVKTFKSTSPLRGWPAGCNGMFGSTMIHIANYLGHYECVFWMEADCVPMSTNWFADLSHAWRARPPGTHIVGCKCDANGNGSGVHITGCALYDPQIARILPGITTCDTLAWDWAYRGQMCAIGSHTNTIGLQYKATTPNPDLLKEPYAIIHGFKTGDFCDMVRKAKL